MLRKFNTRKSKLKTIKLKKFWKKKLFQRRRKYSLRTKLPKNKKKILKNSTKMMKEKKQMMITKKTKN